MKTFTSILSLQTYISEQRTKGFKVGFVPTMGALHAGHISLINESKRNNDITVCSIFINPTQFNNKQDFEKYPITLDSDSQKLLNAGCEVLFAPSVAEMYPNGTAYHLKWEIGELDTCWDGAHRPGHFKGMIQVVSLLLQIVQPDNLYMGLKDLQQFSIVKKFLHETKSSIKLIGCETLREPDGLAMSSRNVRIIPEHKPMARLISVSTYEAIYRIKYLQEPIDTTLQKMRNRFTDKPFHLEYFEMVQLETMRAVKEYRSDTSYAIIIACWLGDVRLIDNMIF